MNVGYRRAAALLAIATILNLVATPLRAQEGGRAGLVVVTGAGDAITRCVEFEGESVSGDMLLARAGLDVVSDPQSSMGATICRIDGVGCDHPAEDCFCKCQGSPCTYWSYWRQDAAGSWVYSGMGASNTQVKDGAVEGWVWGEGTSGVAPEPPALVFGDICAGEPSVGVAAESSVLSATPVFSSSALGAATSAPTEVDATSSWLRVAGVAAIVFVPLAGLALLRRRRSP